MPSWGGFLLRLFCAFAASVSTAHCERSERGLQRDQREQMIRYAQHAIIRIEREKFQNRPGGWSQTWPNEEFNSMESLTTFLDSVLQLVTEPERLEKGYARSVDPNSTGFSAVIGDIHGQLWVLLPMLKIISERFKAYKKPQPVNIRMGLMSNLIACDDKLHYVFLGDYVDRGDRSLHTIILLLAYKVLCPEQVTLLQGNHEQARINTGYGFRQELRSLFSDENSSLVHTKVNNAFSTLPFVASVSGVALAMHGGLTKEFNDACEDVSGNFATCLPFTEAGYLIGRKTTWSDPVLQNGFAKNIVRGDGDMFGPDVVEAFLQTHGLRKLIRGHQVAVNGVEIKGKTVTVFSAADYTRTFSQGRRRVDGNKGGLLYVYKQDDKTLFEKVQTDPDYFRKLCVKFPQLQLLELGSAASVDVHEHWARTEAGQWQSGMQGNMTECAKVVGGTLSAEKRVKLRELLKEVMQETNTTHLAFKAKEMMDESGEADVNNMAELCQASAEKHLVLEVFSKMSSTTDKNEVLRELRELMDAHFNQQVKRLRGQ